MKTSLLLLTLLPYAVGFTIQVLPYSGLDTVCFAKHPQKKATKWARHKRPRKSRPSDINRTPIVYEVDSIPKPPEYTILPEGAEPTVSSEETED